jgi:esterase
MGNWPEPRMVDTGELHLATYEYGSPSAPAVLLLHGFLSTGLVWHDVAAALADEWHVIAIDQRGRAFSDRAPGGDYSTAAYVRDARAVLRKLRIDKLALIGHSMGGANVIAFASEFPDMVTSMVVVDMAPETNRAALTQVAAGVAALSRDFKDIHEARKWQSETLPLISKDAVERRLHSRMVERAGRVVWREDPAILSFRDANPMPIADHRWKQLRKVNCRTLFLLGGASELVSDDTAQKSADTVPGGEWVRVANAGHNVFEDNPADSIASITGFLSGVPAQKAR